MLAPRTPVLAEMGRLGHTRGREVRRMLREESIVVLLVTACLVVLPAVATILQEGDPLVLRPPSGETDSYFGFSLAHYTKNGQKLLLVGAPRSNISVPGEVHSGGLYQCLLSETQLANECQTVYVNMDNKENYTIWAKSNGSEQSLGFSLASDGKAVVVCAPRWYARKSYYNRNGYLPAGMCYAAKSPAYEFKAFSPPFDGQYHATMSYLGTGSCQFGISATYLKGQNTFALGAPGCWVWQGDTWEIGLDSASDTVQIVSSRKLGVLQKEDLGLKPNEGRLYNLYLGYSVASLKFGGKNSIVSSIPRTIWDTDLESNTPFGPTILILVQDPKNQTNLNVQQRISPSEARTGDIRFTFFGYSLATLDLNSDGLEDLVVGAPFYHHSSMDHDQGAIFVYMQTAYESQGNKEKVYKMREEEKAPQRMGRESYSRFGSCVAAVGDLDGDGYEDLAVGAPFMTVVSDKGTGTGAVYIYMGSQNGLEKNAWQIIKAAPNQYGFGSAIAQQLQVAEGGWYDVAVGIYESDMVLVFKSKEIVNITWNLTFNEKIDLRNNTCICATYSSACPCVNAEFCLAYQKKFDKYENTLKLDFNVTLAIASDSQLSFVNGMKKLHDTIEVQEGATSCKPYRVLAKPGLEEIRSYTFTAEVSLANEENNVILDRHSTLKKEAQLNVAVHCASGDISGCLSNITLQHNVLDMYVLKGPPFRILFKIENQGETAYATKLIIKSNVSFIIDTVDAEKKEIECDRNINMEIICNIGSLYSKSEETFNLSLTPPSEFFHHLDTNAGTFKINAEIETLSSLSNPDMAVTNIEVPIIVQGSLSFQWQNSEPGVVDFNSSSYYKVPEDAKYEEELGPEIKHKYYILNRNNFSIFASELNINWPLTIAGKYLLYLLTEPVFSGMSLDCSNIDQIVNPYNLMSRSKTQQNQVKGSPKKQTNGEKTSAFAMVIDGNSPKNMSITCHLGEIREEGRVTVELRARLVLRTLAELEVGTAVKIVSSYADLTVTKMPLNAAQPPPSSTFVTTVISYQKDSPEATVPVWLYVVSVLGGLLVLAIIIVVLWKCGFFERKRIEPAQKENEEQEQLQKEEEEIEGEEAEVKTPISPMLKETENATSDFEFCKA